MKLNAKEISQITLGALSVAEEDGYTVFDRFTAAQLNYYKETAETSYIRAMHSASVMMDFTTDSEELSFDYKADGFISRPFHYFDIYEDDIMILHVGSDDAEVNSGEVKVKLRRGMKRVRIYLPFSRRVGLKDFTLDDGAAIIKSERKLDALILGDSITQGYDAHYPSLHYVSLMTERYSMKYVNQAIGGEKFNAGILMNEKVCDPDVITLAMGINDWANCSFDDTERNAERYFEALTSIYKDVPVVYISPIWIDREGNDTTLPATVEMLESVASSYGAHIIRGLDLVPHDKGMFADGVHPSDLGFSEYSKKLFGKMDGIIDIIKKTKEEKLTGITVL